MPWQFGLILLCAASSLGFGLAIYFRNDSAYSDRFHTTNLISWLLIALFPVLVLFAFFPDSSINGTMFGVSMGGAIAAFVFIWWWGTRATLSSTRMDELRAHITELEKKLHSSPLPQPERPLSQTIIQRFRVNATKKHVAIISGDVAAIKFIDVWVNSENTNLQMARFYDRSMSGTIRYLGAKKDQFGDIVEDTIALELARVTGHRPIVRPATVCVTGSGELASSHKVKRLFHVASVYGEVSLGYRPISSIGQCVLTCLARADAAEFADLDIRSILFPLLGAGTRRVALPELAAELLNGAISYLENTPDSHLECVYFVARDEAEWQACLSILQESPRATALAGSLPGHLARARP